MEVTVRHLICAVVLADSLTELRKQGIDALSRGVDIVECRLDGLKEIDFSLVGEFIRENRDLPLIFSLRSEWNTEVIEPPLKGRKTNLRKLISLEPKYIDLEYPIDMSLLQEISSSTTPVIAALDFEGMAKIDFGNIVKLATDFGREVIIKISATPHSVSDLKTIWRWSRELRKEGLNYIVLGMGQLGQITRIKSNELGNRWMYGRFSQLYGEPFMPGMLSIDELSKSFQSEAWHLANLGNLPEHDALREIYSNLLNAANLNGIFLNLPIATSPELDQILLWIEDGLLDGVNISSPWQVDIATKLDQLDASAIIMGAVNCVVVTKNGLKGYNTQIRGLSRSLEPFSFKRINRVYIDGTERVARAVIHVLKDEVEMIVLRDEMFNEHNDIFDEYPQVIPARESYSDDYDLLVNCNKPAKGFEKVVMLPKSIIDGAKIIFDPMSKLSSPTPIMEEAMKRGTKTLGGFQFFFNTALSSFELWTKRSIPPSMINEKMFDEFKTQIDFGFMLNY